MIVDLKNPEGVDGVDFINIYSKADTLLGRRLSNWAKHDIDISLGKFKSIEGLIFFLGSFNNDLRLSYGYEAKTKGERLDRGIRLPQDIFRRYILEAMNDIICSLPHDDCYEVVEKNLPLVHYYEYNGKRVVPTKWLWQVEEWNTLLKKEFS